MKPPSLKETANETTMTKLVKPKRPYSIKLFHKRAFPRLGFLTSKSSQELALHAQCKTGTVVQKCRHIRDAATS